MPEIGLLLIPVNPPPLMSFLEGAVEGLELGSFLSLSELLLVAGPAFVLFCLPTNWLLWLTILLVFLKGVKVRNYFTAARL